jgi:PIN domain nuclease of toxin-antitoxin system
MLRPLTLIGGLSLGDRFCLARADIAEAAGVEVELIR